jgi:uncharacterized protein (TIGR03382 family)
MKMASRLLAVLSVAGLSAAAMAQPNSTYIALGDSVGFGITTGASYSQISNGDRGYVSLVADWFGSQNGGTRPGVLNLSVFGDSTGSFGTTTNPARALNTNYAALPVSQSARFAAAVAAETGAGRTISAVTVSLGANDLLQVIQQPGFQLLPAPQQVALVGAALQTAQTNLVQIYAGLRAALPTTPIIAVGYYDAFAALPSQPDPTNPLAPFNPNPAFTAAATVSLNQIIEGVATAFGARYVDVFSAFAGQEAVLTNMVLDQTTAFNVHPTPAGYQVIAGQIIPAPGVAALLGLAGLVAVRRRRSAA